MAAGIALLKALVMGHRRDMKRGKSRSKWGASPWLRCCHQRAGRVDAGRIAAAARPGGVVGAPNRSGGGRTGDGEVRVAAAATGRGHVLVAERPPIGAEDRLDVVAKIERHKASTPVGSLLTDGVAQRGLP
jgi:hypothetical protein